MVVNRCPFVCVGGGGAVVEGALCFSCFVTLPRLQTLRPFSMEQAELEMNLP